MNTKLSISNIMKIVNILFLIVLENFILDCGMGFFSVSFLLLAMVYQLFTGGLQSSVSKMVSIRNGKGMGGNSRLILKPAIIYMIIIGIIKYSPGSVSQRSKNIRVRFKQNVGRNRCPIYRICIFTT